MIDREKVTERIDEAVYAIASDLAGRGLWVRDDFGAPNIHAIRDVVSKVTHAVLALVGTEVERLERLAYIGEHRFPDNSWKYRFEELRTDLDRLREQVRVLREALNEHACVEKPEQGIPSERPCSCHDALARTEPEVER